MEKREFSFINLDQPERLDRLLGHICPDLSRTRIQDLCQQGLITVNGSPGTASQKIKNSFSVSMHIPALQDANPQPQEIALDVIYEDDDLLVINKPAGMVVHPAPGSPDQTLVNALLAHCGDSLSGIGGVKRPGIIHRLDKGTSGLLVVAKNDQAHWGLSAQFVDRSLTRTYQALCWGIPNPLEGTIEGNIGRQPHQRQKMAILAYGGKPAKTHYKMLQVFNNFASLVECKLETGRTHQIRVHMTSKGYPIIGDPLYGRIPRAITVSMKEALSKVTQDNTRPLLHAWKIKFIHPSTQKQLSFKVPPPQDFTTALEILS